MNINGFIKIHRKITEWGWYSDPNTKAVFLHFLFTANFKDTEWKGITIKAGQTIFGRKELAKTLGLTVQQVRTAIEHLKSTNEITTKSTNRFTVVTVVNWEKYQLLDDESTNKITTKSTNKQPTSNQQATNKQPHLKKDKNDKKDKNINIYYGEFKNVSLSEEELEKLKERFPYDWRDKIELLSTYMSSTGKRYKSHYATILSWARKEKNNAESTADREYQGENGRCEKDYSTTGSGFRT